ncbi:hypothetical protein ACQKNX_04040 [Lysinibacillus sp. NPDC093712]|uniref:hypothetical protein n=1 Tax=Lysinibacillus sp. NPDC093712 TaxID=3390579 RepID=UPI003D02E0BB
MNNVKKELIKMAGDMLPSKERVKQRVLQRHEVKPKKSIRFRAIATIVTLCLLAFVIQLLDGDKKQSAPLFNQTQLAYYEDILKIISFNPDRESNIEEAYERYEKRVASYYFAQSLGIESTKEERQAEAKKRFDELQMLQESPEYAKLFKKQGLKGYFTKYIEPMLAMMVAEEKLKAFYMEKYPTFPSFIVKDIATREALNYFNAHFSEQAKAFQEELGLKHYSNIRQGTNHIGTVVAIQGNAFLLVEGAVPQDIVNLTQEQIVEKYQNATWYPLISNISLQKGDYVGVQSVGGGSTDEDGSVKRFGLVDAIEIMEPTVTKKLSPENTDEVKQFLQQITWKVKEKNIERPPKYSLDLDEVRVDIWDGYGHSLWLQAPEYGEIQLSQERADQLKALLKIEE